MAVALLLVSGCAAVRSGPGGGAAPAAPPPTLDAAQAALAPPGPTLGARRAGDTLVWLSSTPTRPARGIAELDAYLVETTGEPIKDATVAFDVDMTNMSHGPNVVAASSLGSGHYRGQVRFLMPGPWRVIATIQRPQRDTAKIRFEFNVGLQ